MPKIAYYYGFTFFFYSYDLLERRHVHVAANKHGFNYSAKFWLEPHVEVFEAGELSQKEIREITKAIENNLDRIEEQILRFKNGLKVETFEIY